MKSTRAQLQKLLDPLHDRAPSARQDLDARGGARFYQPLADQSRGMRAFGRRALSVEDVCSLGIGTPPVVIGSTRQGQQTMWGGSGVEASNAGLAYPGDLQSANCDATRHGLPKTLIPRQAAAAGNVEWKPQKAMLQNGQQSKRRVPKQNDTYRKYMSRDEGREQIATWRRRGGLLPTIDGATSPRADRQTLKDPHRGDKTQFTNRKNLFASRAFRRIFRPKACSAGARGARGARGRSADDLECWIDRFG